MEIANLASSDWSLMFGYFETRAWIGTSIVIGHLSHAHWLASSWYQNRIAHRMRFLSIYIILLHHLKSPSIGGIASAT